MPVVAAGGRPADRYQDVTLLQPTVLGGGAGVECAQPESLPVFAAPLGPGCRRTSSIAASVPPNIGSMTGMSRP